MPFLLLDFGSTFTKGILLGQDGTPLAREAVRTTVHTDVMEGYAEILAAMRAGGHEVPATPGEGIAAGTLLACSSAGGGLRLAVVGYERQVTAEAGHRVGLSAGAKVVHVSHGELTTAGIAELRAAKPDVILLVGGTDGGNSEVLIHNAARLAKARVGAPVVVAGNAEAADEVTRILDEGRRRWVLADNVMPRIGVIEPDSARRAIREIFLTHVIGGKGLSKGTDFAAMVRMATPDAMLTGVEVMADAIEGDVMVLDIGGATTDVYSVITIDDEIPRAKEVIALMPQQRSVEGDLGMRWNAPNIVAAARAEHLEPRAPASDLVRWADRVHEETGRLPETDDERTWDLELARMAALVAVRRHARPAAPGEAGRPLADLAHLVGSGGVLRHSEPGEIHALLTDVTTDYAGGWKTPVDAGVSVDTEYLLFAAGLLAADHPELAQAVAARVARSVTADETPEADPDGTLGKN